MVADAKAVSVMTTLEYIWQPYCAKNYNKYKPLLVDYYTVYCKIQTIIIKPD